MNDLLSRVTEKSEPVECLGQRFPSEAVRRGHFLELLAQKLKEPGFRAQAGFPLGTDEAILALSDPPYYTACPNPWIGEFIACYGRPYSADELYLTEPLVADVSEGKNDPIYNAHSYHTKVPHKAIMRYILHYTNPGDFVLDSFCGTGMTGVAAQLCGDRRVVESLGYRVDDQGNVLDRQIVEGRQVWESFSRLGPRFAILNELSPAASFIAANYNTAVDATAFTKEAERIVKEVSKEVGWMYETHHGEGTSRGTINYTL